MPCDSPPGRSFLTCPSAKVSPKYNTPGPKTWQFPELSNLDSSGVQQLAALTAALDPQDLEAAVRVLQQMRAALESLPRRRP